MAISNKNGPTRALIMRVMRHQSLSVLQRRTENLYAHTGSVDVQRESARETAVFTDPLPSLSPASPAQQALQLAALPPASPSVQPPLTAVQRASTQPSQPANQPPAALQTAVSPSQPAAPVIPNMGDVQRAVHPGSQPANQPANSWQPPQNPAAVQRAPAPFHSPAAPQTNRQATPATNSAPAPSSLGAPTIHRAAQPAQVPPTHAEQASRMPVASSVLNPAPLQRASAPPPTSQSFSHQTGQQTAVSPSITHSAPNSASIISRATQPTATSLPHAANVQQVANRPPTASTTAAQQNQLTTPINRAPAPTTASQQIAQQARLPIGTPSVSPAPQTHVAAAGNPPLQRLTAQPAGNSVAEQPASFLPTAQSVGQTAVQRNTMPAAPQTAVSPFQPAALPAAAPATFTQTPAQQRPTTQTSAKTSHVQLAPTNSPLNIQRASESFTPVTAQQPAVSHHAPQQGVAPSTVQRATPATHFSAPQTAVPQAMPAAVQPQTAPAHVLPAVQRQPAHFSAQPAVVNQQSTPAAQRANLPMPQAAHFQTVANQPASQTAVQLTPNYPANQPANLPVSQAPQPVNQPAFTTQPTVQRSSHSAIHSAPASPQLAGQSAIQLASNQPASQSPYHPTAHPPSHPAVQAAAPNAQPISAVQRSAIPAQPTTNYYAAPAQPAGQMAVQLAPNQPASQLPNQPIAQSPTSFTQPVSPVQRNAIPAQPTTNYYAAPAQPAGQTAVQLAPNYPANQPTNQPIAQSPTSFTQPASPVQRATFAPQQAPNFHPALAQQAGQTAVQLAPSHSTPPQTAVSPRPMPPATPYSPVPNSAIQPMPLATPVQRAAQQPSNPAIQQTAYTPQEQMLRSISSLHRKKGTHSEAEDLSWQEVSDLAKSPSSGGRAHGQKKVDRVSVPGIMLQGDKPLRRRKAKVTYINTPNPTVPAPPVAQRQADEVQKAQPETAVSPPSVSPAPEPSQLEKIERSPTTVERTNQPVTSDSATATPLQLAPDGNSTPAEQPLLEQAWPVTPISGDGPATSAPLSNTQRQAAVENHSAVSNVLHRMQAEQPTDSHIELVTPRRPRPATPSRPQLSTAQRSADPISHSPNLSADQAPNPPIQRSEGGSQPAGQMVQTGIGPLPSDLWSLVGDAPPTAQRSTAQHHAEPSPEAPSPADLVQPANPPQAGSPIQRANQPEMPAPQTAVSPPTQQASSDSPAPQTAVSLSPAQPPAPQVQRDASTHAQPPAHSTQTVGQINPAGEAASFSNTSPIQRTNVDTPFHQPPNYPTTQSPNPSALHRAPDSLYDDGILSEDEPPSQATSNSEPASAGSMAAIESDSFSPLSGAFGEETPDDDAASHTPTVTLFTDEAQQGAAASELTQVQIQPHGMLDEMTGYADVMQLENFATVAEEPEAENQISAYISEDDADNNVENVRPMTVRLEDEEETAVVFADGDKIGNALVNAELKENDGMLTMYASENEAQGEEGNTVTLLVQLEGQEQPYLIYASAGRIDEFLEQAEAQDINSQVTVYAEEGEAAQNSDDPISLTMQKTGEREKFIVHASNEAIDQLLLVAETLDNSGSFVAYAVEDIAEQNSDAPIQLIVRRVGEEEIKVAYADEAELEEFTKTADNFRSDLLLDQLAQQIYSGVRQRIALDRERSHAR